MNHRALVLMFSLLASTGVLADAVVPVLEKDPHRNTMGFFDMHICNWESRPLFFKSLFSTTKFKDIESMKVYSPDGKKIVDLDMSAFKQIERKGKPIKRVFMRDTDVPAGSKSGWYSITVQTKDGKEYRARDYVVMNRIGRVGALSPADGAEDVKMPAELKWKPVPGAAHYKVFVRDGFENTMLVKSKLVQKPQLVLKPGVLKAGGYYIWQVHARDVNENIILGDFNSGSVNKWMEFSITE